MPSIVTLLYVGVGGFIGSILRYLIKVWTQEFGGSFPLGTLVVNILGSFFLGLIVSGMEYKEVLTEDTRLFLTVGLLGGFTTMSTFSYDSYRLLERKDLAFFFMNVGGTVVLTLLSVFIGIKLGLILLNK